MDPIHLIPPMTSQTLKYRAVRQLGTPTLGYTPFYVSKCQSGQEPEVVRCLWFGDQYGDPLLGVKVVY